MVSNPAHRYIFSCPIITSKASLLRLPFYHYIHQDYLLGYLAITSTTSFYAACATNNIVSFGSVGGIGVGEINGGLNLGPDNGAYQCCLSCMTDPSCAGAEYWGSFGCWTVEVQSGTFGNPLYFNDSEGVDFLVINGRGQFVNGG